MTQSKGNIFSATFTDKQAFVTLNFVAYKNSNLTTEAWKQFENKHKEYLEQGPGWEIITIDYLGTVPTENEMDMNEVFKSVASELAYQEDIWSDPSMTVAECLIYMKRHLNKAFKAVATTECVGVCDTVLDQIRKVTALGVACGIQHGMPMRHGFENALPFTSGDLIYIIDNVVHGTLYQCVCADQTQAVFGKAIIKDGVITTVYENMVVVFNTIEQDFPYQKVTLDEIRRGIQDAAQKGIV